VQIDPTPGCAHEKHDQSRLLAPVNEEALEQATRLFRALGDTARIRLVAQLAQGPACVTELAELEKQSIAVISQRLRVLRSDNIVRRKREGKHIVYSLADQHVLDLIFNALAHATEGSTPNGSLHEMATPSKGKEQMSSTHTIHENHTHQHGNDCGHTAIRHADHVDYLHDGHLHSLHDGHVDEHALDASAANPDTCTNGHVCKGHDSAHKHGKGCGHEAVPHGNHVDYLVDGHLHHPDGDHCDNHGKVSVV
jgi:DNA-binding transcriptional ArsR family regulator